MFTGLIEAVCPVKSFRQSGGFGVLVVDLGPLADETKIGDSVAINGACLTVSELTGSFATFDLSQETLSKSNIGKLKPSSAVNTESAMKTEARFGGHFVTGHIDGTATISSIDRHSRFAEIKFAASAGLLEQMVVKGSVAVDGISLTVADMDETGFSTAIIPQTLEKTTLGTARAGDLVNIETDIIIKAVQKQLEKILPQKQKLTVEKLKQLGF